MVMHVLIQKEFEQALSMMKYTINHPWKFRNVPLAFSAGLLQLSISCIVECSNIYINLANSQSQFDIIADFIIMLVISDFDNYFYAVRNPDIINDLINDPRYESLFTWETTTSDDATAKISENELKPERVLMTREAHMRPKYIKITFGERTCSNKFFYVVYKTLQLLYTSFYYYFMPFAATFFVWNLLMYENANAANLKKMI